MSEREWICNWLYRNDLNGLYRDKDCDLACVPRVTIAEARALREEFRARMVVAK